MSDAIRLLAEACIDLGIAAAHGGMSAEEAIGKAEGKIREAFPQAEVSGYLWEEVEPIVFEIIREAVNSVMLDNDPLNCQDDWAPVVRRWSDKIITLLASRPAPTAEKALPDQGYAAIYLDRELSTMRARAERSETAEKALSEALDKASLDLECLNAAIERGTARGEVERIDEIIRDIDQARALAHEAPKDESIMDSAQRELVEDQCRAIEGAQEGQQ